MTDECETVGEMRIGRGNRSKGKVIPVQALEALRVARDFQTFGS
jgi:hypothetical protein